MGRCRSWSVWGVAHHVPAAAASPAAAQTGGTGEAVTVGSLVQRSGSVMMAMTATVPEQMMSAEIAFLGLAA